jgi:hypothetical protein
VPANTIDGDMATRWAAEGDGQWIAYDVGFLSTVNEVAVAWVRGNRRKAFFAVDVSIDKKSWKEVWSGESSGTTNELESYPFSPASARYIRLVGHGNSSNKWINIAEVEVYGLLDMLSLPIDSVQASGAKEPHVPANTIDGDMATRWAAEGDGQWIAYDVGFLSTVNEVAVAWVRGNRRKAFFAVEVSIDKKSWKEVLSGESSGTTNELESYTFSPASARYVRLVGHGNSSNKWINIAEVEVYGFIN